MPWSIRCSLCLLLLFLAGPAVGEFDYSPGSSERIYPLATLPLPERGKPVRDPFFNTTLVRLTDVRDGPFPTGIKGLTNEYSRFDPVNADASLLLVRGTDASWHLYDLVHHRYLGPILGRRGDFSPRWDASDPDVLFFIMGTKFYRYHVHSKKKSLIQDFREYYPTASYIRSGKGESSLDSRYWAFMVIEYDNGKPAGRRRTLLDLVTYDATAERIVGSYRSVKKSFGKKIPRTVTISMSGSYVVVEYIPQIFRYRLDWSDGRQLPGRFGHGDLALSRERRDLFVAQDNGSDYIVMVDLGTLERTNVMHIPFHSSLSSGVSYPGFHISGNCADTPGWVLVSTYGSADKATYWSDGAIFLLELAANGRHWRIAHTHSRTAKGKSKDYWAEAFATIDRRGKRVFWPSNWGNGTPKYVDLYEVVLPDSWFEQLGKRKR